MAHIGHPILGDTVYGRKKPELGQDSQCLHAGALCASHFGFGQTTFGACHQGSGSARERKCSTHRQGALVLI
jgi:hypothetical protein